MRFDSLFTVSIVIQNYRLNWSSNLFHYMIDFLFANEISQVFDRALSNSTFAVDMANVAWKYAYCRLLVLLVISNQMFLLYMWIIFCSPSCVFFDFPDYSSCHRTHRYLESCSSSDDFMNFQFLFSVTLGSNVDRKSPVIFLQRTTRAITNLIFITLSSAFHKTGGMIFVQKDLVTVFDL